MSTPASPSPSSSEDALNGGVSPVPWGEALMFGSSPSSSIAMRMGSSQWSRPIDYLSAVVGTPVFVSITADVSDGSAATAISGGMGSTIKRSPELTDAGEASPPSDLHPSPERSASRPKSKSCDQERSTKPRPPITFCPSHVLARAPDPQPVAHPLHFPLRSPADDRCEILVSWFGTRLHPSRAPVSLSFTHATFL